MCKKYNVIRLRRIRLSIRFIEEGEGVYRLPKLCGVSKYLSGRKI